MSFNEFIKARVYRQLTSHVDIEFGSPEIWGFEYPDGSVIENRDDVWVIPILSVTNSEAFSKKLDRLEALIWALQDDELRESLA